MLVLLFCGVYVLCVQCELTLAPDRPSLKVPLSQRAELSSQNHTKKHAYTTDLVHNPVIEIKNLGRRQYCKVLIFKSSTLNDTGFYQCLFSGSNVLSHGTYLQVYIPIEKTIKLSERVKDGILTAEGILLLLCVVLPSVTLLFKSKNLNELEKKKMQKEEENIYQGLNLDDCYEAYDQIEHRQGPYEDVGNNEEDIQLEKP
ncbi:hypothetical protein WMY93_026491 [Mugilogobius chulae]|uniref:B-cell antigen receptor complex-associated protein alpha chain n=1 Tax=Mugilogobius chulae TaxID=88201 RepID=A0AAW0N3C7_9GOBI